MIAPFQDWSRGAIGPLVWDDSRVKIVVDSEHLGESWETTLTTVYQTDHGCFHGSWQRIDSAEIAHLRVGLG